MGTEHTCCIFFTFFFFFFFNFFFFFLACVSETILRHRSFTPQNSCTHCNLSWHFTLQAYHLTWHFTLQAYHLTWHFTLQAYHLTWHFTFCQPWHLQNLECNWITKQCIAIISPCECSILQITRWSVLMHTHLPSPPPNPPLSPPPASTPTTTSSLLSCGDPVWLTGC